MQRDGALRRTSLGRGSHPHIALQSSNNSGGGGGDLASTDLLTCGDCKTKFPLQELVAYIQHKATHCSGQPGSELTNGPDMEDHSQEQKYREKCVGSPSVTGSGQPDEDEEGRLVESQVESQGEKLDAETNTTSTEPVVLTCSVCKQELSSAWTLMQHIQV